MSFPFNEIEFKRNAVQPIECIKAGWNLIKSQYWLFVGMTCGWGVNRQRGSAGNPDGADDVRDLSGAFQTRRGQPIEFGLLFKGFDYFGDAVIATLLHMIPIVIDHRALLTSLYIVGHVCDDGPSRGGEPDPAALLGFFGFLVLVWLVIMVLLIVLSVSSLLLIR